MLYKSLSLIGLYPVCFVCWTSLTVDLFMCSVMLDCEFIFGKALFLGILWRVYPSCMSSYLFIHTYCFSIEFLTWEIWDQVVEKWTPNLCKWRLMIRILRGDYFLSYPEPRQRGKLSCSPLGQWVNFLLVHSFKEDIAIWSLSLCSGLISNLLSCIHSKPCF